MKHEVIKTNEILAMAECAKRYAQAAAGFDFSKLNPGHSAEDVADALAIQAGVMEIAANRLW